MFTQQEILDTYIENRALKIKLERLQREVEYLHRELDRVIHAQISLLRAEIGQVPEEIKQMFKESEPKSSTREEVEALFKRYNNAV